MALAVAEPSGTWPRCRVNHCRKALCDGLRALLAGLRIELKFPRLALDLVQPREVSQAFLGDLAAMIAVQVVQLSARVRRATHFDHAAIEECLVARVVIAVIA
jgi:hypothetical protein